MYFPLKQNMCCRSLYPAGNKWMLICYIYFSNTSVACVMSGMCPIKKHWCWRAFTCIWSHFDAFFAFAMYEISSWNTVNIPYPAPRDGVVVETDVFEPHVVTTCRPRIKSKRTFSPTLSPSQPSHCLRRRGVELPTLLLVKICNKYKYKSICNICWMIERNNSKQPGLFLLDLK